MPSGHWVAIPSLSGQCFLLRHYACDQSTWSRNPFFIRSMFLTSRDAARDQWMDKSQSLLYQVNVSYSFAIQLEPWSDIVAIPSLSGQCFLPSQSITGRFLGTSRNPFFIRSMFLTLSSKLMDLQGIVKSQSLLYQVNVSYESGKSNRRHQAMMSQSLLYQVNVSYFEIDKLR